MEEHQNILSPDPSGDGAMAEILGLQALPEAGGGDPNSPMYSGMGSWISVFTDCAGRWSVTCIP